MYISVAEQAQLRRVQALLKSTGLDKSPEYYYLSELNIKLAQERENQNSYSKALKKTNRKLDKNYGRGRKIK